MHIYIYIHHHFGWVKSPLLLAMGFNSVPYYMKRWFDVVYPGAAIDACHVGTQWDKVHRGESGRFEGVLNAHGAMVEYLADPTIFTAQVNECKWSLDHVRPIFAFWGHNAHHVINQESKDLPKPVLAANPTQNPGFLNRFCSGVESNANEHATLYQQCSIEQFWPLLRAPKVVARGARNSLSFYMASDDPEFASESFSYDKILECLEGWPKTSE